MEEGEYGRRVGCQVARNINCEREHGIDKVVQDKAFNGDEH